MSGDTLTYDLSSMTEGTPSVFVKKDWLNILDNQNGSYQGNQSVVDTSQLANSNKYMNYREAYLAVPMVLTATTSVAGTFLVAPQTAGTSADYGFGLRNWFGSIIHSFTLDYNGTTIIQQTPYCSMYNCFKLMTTLSMADVEINGADMGFYPDNPLSFGFASSIASPTVPTTSVIGSTAGLGTINNTVAGAFQAVSGVFANNIPFNEGLLARQRYIAFDLDGVGGGAQTAGVGGIAPRPYSQLISVASVNQQYKSYINLKNATTIQYSILATIHLKHIHNFFQNVPLLKGVFMKMTLNLNQTSLTITSSAGATPSWNGTAIAASGSTVVVNSALGGVSPIMITSDDANAGIVLNVAGTSTVSIAVGNKPVVAAQSALVSAGLPTSIQLYVPAYTFNPQYEDAYLSSPVKKIVYTDIYQYQFNIGQGANFNQLITNGIANIKSVLVIPYYTQEENCGLQPYQSPFDDAGAGSTSPLCLLTNFNVVVAGQNMIYNTQQRSYEQFLHQLRGCNSVNADLTDGLTSGLISKLGFEMKQCFYYVDCSRMLPVEEAVPKSVSIIGTSSSLRSLQCFVFIEYGVEVSVDVLTGARV
jgi:hypothetical protein